MMPETNYLMDLIKIGAALSVSTGLMAWFRKGSVEEDVVIAESQDFVLDALSDADRVNKIDLHTGRNVRDQLTVEEAEEMEKESRLRKWGRRN